jgi:lysozyme
VKLAPRQSLDWPIDYEDGVCKIAESENCFLKAYQCPAGVWTCGWGETSDITPTTQWTQEFADQRFCDSLRERTVSVLAACTVEPTGHQLAALVSFAYNYGGWRTSQVLKAHNRGDYLAASRAFSLVNKCTDPVTKQKVVSNGLTARRAWEAALYLKSVDGVALPQAVEDESKLANSPIAAGGAVTAGTGIIGLFSTVGGQLGTVNIALQQTKAVVVDTLGIGADMFLPIALMVAGGVVIWFRVVQRKQGWA